MQFKSVEGKFGTSFTYRGFNSVMSTDILLPDELVAFVSYEGEVELWHIENAIEAVSELRRYYKEQWERENIGIVIGKITERLWHN
jgi:hypothetical protein